ncbi:putative membrane protein [Serratia plymuthica A30]|nr:putative membrane protein [Serratia plymuthica A30]
MCAEAPIPGQRLIVRSIDIHFAAIIWEYLYALMGVGATFFHAL